MNRLDAFKEFVQEFDSLSALEKCRRWKAVYYTDATPEDKKEVEEAYLELGEEFGERLANAITECFREGLIVRSKTTGFLWEEVGA